MRLSPRESVRAMCTQCLGLSQYNSRKVADCQGDQAFTGACAFFPYRLRGRITMKTIRRFCLDCQGSPSGVRECPTEDCPVWSYRLGKNSARAGLGQDSHRMKAVRELRKMPQVTAFT
ncbi:MAG: hypothetical protein A4E66_00824 [Syntrophus sp. PtaB.Bin001]|nr:MAG: hypothetical protein A4E66_00824 [Syntrophus sp. PtaB.Bin001]